jgi:NADPH2:quinone reductase
VGPIDPALLSAKGSLFLTRPTLAHYISTREELQLRSGEVLSWIQEGKLTLRIQQEYALAHAEAAHRALEGRLTTGKVLLVP